MKAVPLFPNFKKLQLEDRPLLGKYTYQFPPYSDYNFVSLWSYNTEDDIAWSVLHSNLIIKFRGYITNEPFYSFLGNTNVKQTIETLLSYYNYQALQLIPEANIHGLKKDLEVFSLSEDPNNFDYILSTKAMCTLEGHQWEEKRYKIHRFLKDYPKAQQIIIDLQDANIQKQLIELFFIWEKNKGLDRTETLHELTALKRLLHDAKYFNLLTIGIYNDSELCGFAIAEIVSSDYAVCHFVKGNIIYRGIFDMLYFSLAQELFQQRNCIYLNREQDLGLETLRNSKESWHPVFFLKKYCIESKKP